MKKGLLLGLVFIFLFALALRAQDVDVPGNLTMVDSTANAGNILKGGVPFIHNVGGAGGANTFIGRNAGNLTMTGANNTGNGVGALFSNVGGTWNTATGAGALSNNTSGNANTATGLNALVANSMGSNNTATGVNALLFNIGDNNTATGVNALERNDNGGHDNTASGVRALQRNTNGSWNTASGGDALRDNTTGMSNTAMGVNALLGNTSGSNNTAIGTNADVFPGNLTNATAIGAGAVVDDSNKIVLGNSLVTVVETAGKVVANSGFNGQCTTVFVPFGGGNVTVTCNQDVAETFGSLEATEPGDLVVLVNQSASMPTVRKSTRPYESLLVGAVSTSPGLVFDRGETLLAGDNSRLITSEKTVVGLVGRVPVNVSLENGSIAVGDPLTSSSTEGVAMKATKAGQIVGYALENADQKGKVLVHLQPGYYIPPKQLALLNEIDELKAQVSELRGLFQAVLSPRLEDSAGDVAKR